MSNSNSGRVAKIGTGRDLKINIFIKSLEFAIHYSDIPSKTGFCYPCSSSLSLKFLLLNSLISLFESLPELAQIRYNSTHSHALSFATSQKKALIGMRQRVPGTNIQPSLHKVSKLIQLWFYSPYIVWETPSSFSIARLEPWSPGYQKQKDTWHLLMAFCCPNAHNNVLPAVPRVAGLKIFSSCETDAWRAGCRVAILCSPIDIPRLIAILMLYGALNKVVFNSEGHVIYIRTVSHKHPMSILLA